MASEGEKMIPLFCVKTMDKRSGRTIYFNFKGVSSVPEPAVEITEAGLIRESLLPSTSEQNYMVPLMSSPMFYRKRDSKSGDSEQDSNASEPEYAIEIGINARFALRKVVPSLIIRNYVASVALSVVMDKYNEAPTTSDPSHQYLGHKLDLDQPNMEFLPNRLEMEHTNEIVRNKIVLVDSGRELPASSEVPKSAGDEAISYDLHLRPALGILTCSISTDKLPKSLAFNDDRIRVELDEKRNLELNIPLFIDLNVPVKYKFDEHLCLFRAVFTVCEQPIC